MYVPEFLLLLNIVPQSEDDVRVAPTDYWAATELIQAIQQYQLPDLSLRINAAPWRASCQRRVLYSEAVSLLKQLQKASRS